MSSSRTCPHDRRRPPDPDTRRARHVPALRTEGEDGVSFPMRPGEVDVTWRYDLYHPGDDEPFHSDYHRSADMLALLLPITLGRDDVDRIEIVRCPTVGLT